MGDDFNDQDDEGHPSEQAAAERSSIALEVERLKKSVIEAAEKRGRLPQPLFWSLFGHAIKSIREKKQERRELSELLAGSSEQD